MDGWQGGEPHSPPELALTHTPSPFLSLPVWQVNGSGIGKKLADFKAALKAKEWPEITQLRTDVEQFASQFPCVGFEESEMKYK